MPACVSGLEGHSIAATGKTDSGADARVSLSLSRGGRYANITSQLSRKRICTVSFALESPIGSLFSVAFRAIKELKPELSYQEGRPDDARSTLNVGPQSGVP